YVLKNTIVACIKLAIMSPLAIVVLFYNDVPFSRTGVLALPGIVMFVLFGFGATLYLGTITCRVPDIAFLSTSLMRAMLFLTPIFWWPDSQDDMRFIVAELNPIHHLIAVVRLPLLGIVPSVPNWVTAGCCTALSLLAGLIVYGCYRRRLATWL